MPEYRTSAVSRTREDPAIVVVVLLVGAREQRLDVEQRFPRPVDHLHHKDGDKAHLLRGGRVELIELLREPLRHLSSTMHD